MLAAYAYRRYQRVDGIRHNRFVRHAQQHVLGHGHGAVSHELLAARVGKQYVDRYIDSAAYAREVGAVTQALDAQSAYGALYGGRAAAFEGIGRNRFGVCVALAAGAGIAAAYRAAAVGRAGNGRNAAYVHAYVVELFLLHTGVVHLFNVYADLFAYTGLAVRRHPAGAAIRVGVFV